MAKETLLATLNETLRELTEGRAQREAVVGECRSAVEQARAEVQAAQEHEACAVYDDEQVQTKTRELLTHVNRLTDKPQALLDKIERLSAEQHKTYLARQAAADHVRQCQQELQRAETRLAVALKQQEVVQTRWQETAAEIQRVQSGQ